ncbi:AraC family transcriptional regulator [Mucilaginibacter sp. PAMB04274]|uniref:helix-turn-helix domain-containing protein n=1 Tax=Mucilaginibacter sp. PAMB04274 TaxID=3138568 RepID=UPI0031F6F02C
MIFLLSSVLNNGKLGMQDIYFEKIKFEEGKSFRLIYPEMRNKFFWHCHPEIELVYIEADSGIRHIGTHVSTYTHSDLVLIGNNLAHLNFDYRLQQDYTQIVIQLRTDFLGTALKNAPEFAKISALLHQADYGVAFQENTKIKIAELLKNLKNLDTFDQLLQIIKVFSLLAESVDGQILNKDLKSKAFLLKDKLRMGDIYEYIDKAYDQRPDVNVVAAKVNMTTPAFCRYFKRQTEMTFTDFVNQYRIERAKNLLMQGYNVLETCYAVGFESLSHFNKLFKTTEGRTPSAFKRSSRRI